MGQSILQWLGNDYVAAVLALGMIALYRAFLLQRLKRDPLYTVQAVNAVARAAWVEMVMSNSSRDVLAVQTLRNSIMGPTFLASTAVLLIIGTLTLSAQGANLANTWHALNLSGSIQTEFFVAKLVLLLMDFFVAFFAFTMAIRMFIHVGYMINVPEAKQNRAITPKYVSFHLNRAGRFHTIGMRAYYYSVPLVFWLFGPLLMLSATVALVFLMHRMDRAPKIDLEHFSVTPSD
ncbi:MAG TPA: DUF599 domain-containing protein [Burkholderiales bacterium]|nr:DUF599 domain-containing protein [Burkholderiales bacterium]